MQGVCQRDYRERARCCTLERRGSSTPQCLYCTGCSPQRSATSLSAEARLRMLLPRLRVCWEHGHNGRQAASYWTPPPPRPRRHLWCSRGGRPRPVRRATHRARPGRGGDRGVQPRHPAVLHRQRGGAADSHGMGRAYGSFGSCGEGGAGYSAGWEPTKGRKRLLAALGHSSGTVDTSEPPFAPPPPGGCGGAWVRRGRAGLVSALRPAGSGGRSSAFRCQGRGRTFGSHVIACVYVPRSK